MRNRLVEATVISVFLVGAASRCGAAACPEGHVCTFVGDADAGGTHPDSGTGSGGGGGSSSDSGSGGGGGSSDSGAGGGGGSPVLDAGTVITLARKADLSASAIISGSAIDATHLYFGERFDNTGSGASYHLRRVPLAGGAIQDLGDQGGEARSIGIDETEVFLCRADAIIAMPKSGGAPRVVGAAANGCRPIFGSGPAESFAMSAADVFFADGDWSTNVYRVSKTGGTPVLIHSTPLNGGGSNTNSVQSMHVAGSSLYVSSSTALEKMDFSGANSVSILPAGSTFYRRLASANGKLFAQAASDFHIDSFGFDGSNISPETEVNVDAFVIDGNDYWYASSTKLKHSGPGLLGQLRATLPFAGTARVFSTQALIVAVSDLGAAAYVK